MAEVSMLSTVDNPWNPFTNFDEWLNFDLQKGYNCSAYLMRIAKISDDMSDEAVNEEINRAILRIIDLEPERYKRVIDPLEGEKAPV